MIDERVLQLGNSSVQTERVAIEPREVVWAVAARGCGTVDESDAVWVEAQYDLVQLGSVG